MSVKPTVLVTRKMMCRASIIYIAGLAMVRIAGDRRFAGKHSTFDIILSIILGSTLSRTINGAAPFWVTIGAGFVLVSIHRFVAFLTAYSRSFSIFISGRSLMLIRDGEIQWNNMHKGHISQRDLMASLRSQAHLCDPNEVKMARLECGGDISVIPRPHEPQIVEINVEAGIQTIQLKLE